MKTKKLLSLILALAIVLCTLPFGTLTANAETTTLNGANLTYTILNGEVTITECDTSISGDVTIPSTLGGYPVTSIGIFAFEYCSSLISITIPDSVTNIGDRAFEYCNSLKTVYYCGTEYDWVKITINNYNNATRYYHLYDNDFDTTCNICDDIPLIDNNVISILTASLIQPMLCL